MEETGIQQMEMGGEQNSQKDFYTNQLRLVLSRLKTGILIWKEAFVLQPITGIGQSFRFMDMTWRVIPLLSHGIWDIAHMLRELQEWMNTRGRKIIILPTFIRIT